MRTVIALLAALLIALGVVEIAARLLGVGQFQENPRYIAISHGFPQLTQLINDKQAHNGLRYYDFYLYAAAPFATSTVNFTNYHSSRLTPSSLPRSQAKMIVWTFGGSTMQNVETTDDLSIANTIAKSLNAHGLSARVENFGVGSFQSSVEMVQFSRLITAVPDSERPSIAIFYDGFNDAAHSYLFGPGAIQRDLGDKVAMLVEERSSRLTIYGASSWLSQWSKAWAALVHPRIQLRLFGAARVGASDENLSKAVATYVRNVAMSDAICERFHISCFFILQPLVVTKTPLNALERDALAELDSQMVSFVRRFYDQVRIDLTQKSNFIDLSGALNGRTMDDFYDLGHTGALTSPVIGHVIADEVLRRMAVRAAPQARVN